MRNRLVLSFVSLFVATLIGCDSSHSVRSGDAGADGRLGLDDGGTTDGAWPDATEPDAAEPDAEPARDGAPEDDAGPAYCPQYPVAVSLDGGSCPTLDAGVPPPDSGAAPDGGVPDTRPRFTLTVEVTRGRTFFDASSPDTDAIGRLVVVAFDGPFLCGDCDDPEVVSAGVVEDADLSDPAVPEVVMLPDVPAGGAWLFSFLDDNENGTSGDEDFIDVGDLWTPTPIVHTTCASETTAITLAHRLVRVSGTATMDPAITGVDVTGLLAIVWLGETGFGESVRGPVSIAIVEDADIGTPVPYELDGYLGPEYRGQISLLSAPATIYYAGLLDADDSGLESDPTPGDIFAARLTPFGTSPISPYAACFDDSGLEFSTDLVFNFVVPDTD